MWAEFFSAKQLEEPYETPHWRAIHLQLLPTVFVHELSLAEATGESLSSVASHVALQVA